jgi:hypothetical protein
MISSFLYSNICLVKLEHSGNINNIILLHSKACLNDTKIELRSNAIVNASFKANTVTITCTNITNAIFNMTKNEPTILIQGYNSLYIT